MTPDASTDSLHAQNDTRHNIDALNDATSRLSLESPCPLPYELTHEIIRIVLDKHVFECVDSGGPPYTRPKQWHPLPTLTSVSMLFRQISSKLIAQAFGMDEYDFFTYCELISAGIDASLYIVEDFERLWTYIIYNLDGRPQKKFFGQGPYSQRLFEFAFGNILLVDCPLMKMMAIFRGIHAAYHHIAESADYMDMHITYSRMSLLRRFCMDVVLQDFYQENLVYLGVSLQDALFDLFQKIFLLTDITEALYSIQAVALVRSPTDTDQSPEPEAIQEVQWQIAGLEKTLNTRRTLRPKVNITLPIPSTIVLKDVLQYLDNSELKILMNGRLDDTYRCNGKWNGIMTSWKGILSK